MVFAHIQLGADALFDFLRRAYAIHGTTHVNRLGQRASKGCVRLHPANAAVLFDLVQKRGMKNTRIIIGSGSMADLKNRTS